jgi:hypothetical protein
MTQVHPLYLDQLHERVVTLLRENAALKERQLQDQVRWDGEVEEHAETHKALTQVLLEKSALQVEIQKLRTCLDMEAQQGHTMQAEITRQKALIEKATWTFCTSCVYNDDCNWIWGDAACDPCRAKSKLMMELGIEIGIVVCAGGLKP